MHEAGLVASILEIAQQEAERHGCCRITRIRLKLGCMTGVVRESLDFAFEALRTGTPADRAVLEIEPVPLLAQCPACGWSGEPPQDYCFFCPTCASPVAILSGREIELHSVDAEEMHADPDEIEVTACVTS